MCYIFIIWHIYAIMANVNYYELNMLSDLFLFFNLYILFDDY